MSTEKLSEKLLTAARVHSRGDLSKGELLKHAATAQRMEAVLHSVFEFMSGEWEPDDLDRHKLLVSVAEFSGDAVEDGPEQKEIG